MIWEIRSQQPKRITMKKIILIVSCAGFLAGHAVARDCLRYFHTGKNGEVGVRNNCGECKVAVIVFRSFTGKSEIKRFKVEGHSETKVPVKGWKETELIGEEPCK